MNLEGRDGIGGATVGWRFELLASALHAQIGQPTAGPVVEPAAASPGDVVKTIYSALRN